MRGGRTRASGCVVHRGTCSSKCEHSEQADCSNIPALPALEGVKTCLARQAGIQHRDGALCSQ